MRKIYRLVKAFLGLKRIRTWGPFTETFERTGFDHAFSVSWSQGGEDLALDSIFNSPTVGKYLDVGAHHPSRFSVTRMLYQRGWSGVNIEANPELIPEFEKKRPRDTNLNFAVGLQKEYNFKVFEEPALSTFVESWQKKFVSEGAKIAREIVVPGVTLRKILDQHFPHETLDLLLVDVEGADEEVLRSLDLTSLEKSRYPKVIVLETAPPVERALEMAAVRIAKDVGYIPYLVLPMSTILVLPERLTSRA